MAKARIRGWILLVIALIVVACGSSPSTQGFTDPDATVPFEAGAPGADTGPPVGGGQTAYTVRVSVTGLLGAGFVLSNTGTDDLAIPKDGDYAFATHLKAGSPYEVKVKAQPTTPSQDCVITGGAGMVPSADVHVLVNCSTKLFKVGGTVTGLLGSGLTLQDNGGDNLAITADGAFTFATPIASGAPFAVTVLTQPGGPAQTCVVTGDHGTVASGDVSSVTVNCATNSYTIGGTVSGLAGTLVLRNDNGADAGVDSVTINANGAFAFPTPVLSGAYYHVTVTTQPGTPSQTCTFSGGSGGDGGASATSASGQVANANVTAIAITCVTNKFTVGGTVTLLGGTVALQNNGSDSLAVSTNGTFTFLTAVASGQTYTVQVLVPPSTPVQTCHVEHGTGTIASQNVTDVVVTCSLSTCTAPFENCDNDDHNGCETNTSNDVDHCGACSTVCAPQHVVGRTCTSGHCGYTACLPNFTDCDGDPLNGCERSTATLNDCGGCGHVCAPTNVSAPTCGTGSCDYGACSPLFGDCDSNRSNGCERSTATLTDCGGCNVPCGRLNAVPTCATGVCAIASCVGTFASCDGSDLTGCETDTASDVHHCGSCTNACAPLNAVSATCGGGQCGYSACNAGFDNCDANPVNGCERSITTLTDCGGCNAACNPAHATGPKCANGSCDYATCSGLFADCDGTRSNGCERSIGTITDCGGCGIGCGFPSATADCGTGTCTFTGCLPNSWNLDGNPSNGCEYACVFQSATDTPDMGFVDANCDGIDGDPTKAIFVDAATGNDANAGTRAAPKKTVQSGITAANAANPKKDVYVARGNYPEEVVLANGINVYGGYDAANKWARATSNVSLIASPGIVGVHAVSLSTATELQLVSVTSSNASTTNASGDGLTSVGILIVNSSGGVTVRGCAVTSGSGAAGAGGATGAGGGAGNAGGFASGTSAGGGGGGCNGANGGSGAAGVGCTGSGNGGNPGLQASGGGAGAAGGGAGGSGSCGTTSSSDGQGAPGVFSNGIPGGNGGNASAGSGFGLVDGNGNYVPPGGASGAPGAPGGGGGGGGSGGGTAHGTNLICSDCSCVSSGAGGGGGGGGCGGGGGVGGHGGGGSMAIVVVSSSVTLDQTRMTTSNGGGGGTGGSGGIGGGGGSGGGGAGGQSAGGSCSTRSGGAGAAGSGGGQGGRGGGGSGGTGGASICVVYKGGSPTRTSTQCTNGSPGAGGNGGSNGSTTAAHGADGVSGDIRSSF